MHEKVIKDETLIKIGLIPFVIFSTNTIIPVVNKWIKN